MTNETTEPQVTEATATSLGLTPAEYASICEVLRRTPSYTELGVYSVMWSEHCSYKNSIDRLKTLPRSSPRMLVAAGEENAGVIDIGDGFGVAFKIESHNHPSAVEPFQGAATGVGGILRDIFTMGARPIAALNSLRFGDFESPRTQFLVRGVVAGIGHYGNCFGVPTVAGEVYFDRCYTDNPLVNAMAVGIVPADKIASAKASGVGNPVFIMGSRTGRDGIHGASLLASREFDSKTDEMRPTVQVGDPFAEKLLLEATLELIEAGVVEGIQDMGAAGISCSTSEMSAKGGVGMRINLDLVPLRQDAMTAYEIMLSESQERMLVVIKAGLEQAAKDICDKWDVPLVLIGEVTNTGNIEVYRHNELVCNVPAESLVLGGGAPVYIREQKKPDYIDFVNRPTEPGPTLNEATCTESLERLLASPSIASRQWIREQYDSQVGTNTVVRIGSDAAVMRVREVPGKGIAVTTDCNSRYVYVNPYRGAMIAVAEAARNVACVGAEPVAITNCLNFGNPYDPEVFWQFAEAVRGIGDACRAFRIPVTGGNVSFHNESQQHAVFPTPTIGMLGLIDDVSATVGGAFLTEGDLIMLLGAQKGELGASEYVKVIRGRISGDAPSLNLKEEMDLQRLVIQAIRDGLLTATHDCAEGGLLVALAEMSFPLGIGVNVEVHLTPRADHLFGEAQSRILATCPEANGREMLSRARAAGVPCAVLGRTEGYMFQVNSLVNQPVEYLRELYMEALPLLMMQAD